MRSHNITHSGSRSPIPPVPRRVPASPSWSRGRAREPHTMTHYDTLGLTAEAQNGRRARRVQTPRPRPSPRPPSGRRARVSRAQTRACTIVSPTEPFARDTTPRSRLRASRPPPTRRRRRDGRSDRALPRRFSRERLSRRERWVRRARRARVGRATPEIPVGELQSLRRTHDECVLECGGTIVTTARAISADRGRSHERERESGAN